MTKDEFIDQRLDPLRFEIENLQVVFKATLSDFEEEFGREARDQYVLENTPK